MTSSPITVSVIIPTYNRLNYLLEALDSVLKQKLEDKYSFSIIVSDNSTNSDTEKHFSSNLYPNVKYIKRYPTITPGLKHFNTILEEVDTDFFMIFHDDDIMMENMIAKLLACFSLSTVAVSSNAYILRNNKRTKTTLVPNVCAPVLINTKKELLTCFMTGCGSPFPGYLYRRIVSQMRFDFTRYNKYGDLPFTVGTLDYGSIYLTREPLFYYRLHNGQDSFCGDFVGKSRLIHFVVKETGYSRKDKHIVHWRLANIYEDFKTNFFLKHKTSSLKRILQFIRLCTTNHNIMLAVRLMVRICLMQANVILHRNQLKG